jgi:hypothetical protein
MAHAIGVRAFAAIASRKTPPLFEKFVCQQRLIFGYAFLFLNMTPAVQYRTGSHRGKPVVFILFEFDKLMNERVKKLPTARWSTSQKK